MIGDLDAVDALPRRVPVPSLRPAADQCLPTGVSLAGARVVVMRDEGGVGDALVKRLHKAGATALVLDPGTPTDDVLAHLEQWCAEGPVSGVYWLAALDDEGDLAAYDLTTWQEALRRRVKALYATMRRLWDDDAFLVSATRLGGYHGYSAAGATSALGGAVTGFTKSYKKERPDALVKAVDLPVDRRTAAVADLLIEETLRDPGCVEIGRVDGRRFGIALLEQPFPARASDGMSRLRQRRRDAADVRLRRARHRRGRQHRLGDHRRPRCRLGWDLPPARPHAGARPGRPRHHRVPHGAGIAQGHHRGPAEGAR